MAKLIQRRSIEDAKNFGRHHKKIKKYFGVIQKKQHQQPQKTKRNTKLRKKKYNSYTTKYAKRRRMIYIQYQKKKPTTMRTFRQLTLLENKIWDTND